jgi:predicted nucleotidyltransferase
MLKLTREEQAWLNDYRKAIEGKHPGVVHEMLIYGSKARGQAHAESDLDVLLVVTNEAGILKKKLRRIGYLLAATSNVLPSKTLTREHCYADAISRAYYAILHAAKAALHIHDVVVASHAAVRRMFGLHLVRAGEIEP